MAAFLGETEINAADLRRSFAAVVDNAIEKEEFVQEHVPQGVEGEPHGDDQVIDVQAEQQEAVEEENNPAYEEPEGLNMAIFDEGDKQLWISNCNC